MLYQFLLSFIGALLTANALFLAACTNFHFGIIATIVLGMALLIYGLFFQKINTFTRKGLLRFFRYFLYVCFLFFVGVTLFVACYGTMDNVTYTEDALIVLGAAVRGKTVSLPLAQRLDKAISYYQKNPKALIIVSGGQGAQELVTEAYAMEQYLLAHGVSKDRIVREEQATSTFENFQYSKKILDKTFPDGYTTAFITNDFHVYRAVHLAENAGVAVRHLHAKIEWYTIAVNYTREFCAVVKMWLFGT